jgi:hypothetical protein
MLFLVSDSAITKNNEVDEERTDRKRKLLLESLVSGFRICFFSDMPYEVIIIMISYPIFHISSKSNQRSSYRFRIIEPEICVLVPANL